MSKLAGASSSKGAIQRKSGLMLQVPPIPRPLQALVGVAFRQVFASYPSRKAQRFKQLEEVAIIDLAIGGFVSTRHAGNLHIADVVEVCARDRGQVSLLHSRVVVIGLQADIGKSLGRQPLAPE